MKTNWCRFLFIVLCSGLQQNFAQRSTYRAAVVEYAPKLNAETPEHRLLENTQEYINYIEQAADQQVDIIVFPEDGLTGWKQINSNSLEQLSTEIPNPKIQTVSPCTTPLSTFSKSFIDLSCAAQTHKVYTVVNLIERESNTTNTKVYHNTNVVFDKNGNIIARYRKMNLFNEPVFEPGTETVTFKTDFGVTFATFICFDILFKNSALDVLSNPSVTDVVYSVAWFSELPFLEALSVQHGYAISNGVNLLSSGFNGPADENGGSGIFLADGRIAESYVSGARSSKMIIQDVPKITARHTNACHQTQNALDAQERIGGILPDISSFKTSRENMANYTFKSLNFNNKDISDTICVDKYCCSFEIVLGKNSNQSSYVYKLAAFYGTRQTSRTRTIGIHDCGLVACLNESNTSCGLRNAVPPQELFESISVKGTFDLKESSTQPATLRFDMKPLTGYTYCTKPLPNDTVEVLMATTSPVDSLLSFGIYGRVYSNDDKPTGSLNSASFFDINIHIVLAISIFIFLFQD